MGTHDMNEKPRERAQFTLSSKDCEAFFKAKSQLEQELGISLSNADVVRLAVATQLKHMEAKNNGR